MRKPTRLAAASALLAVFVHSYVGADSTTRDAAPGRPQAAFTLARAGLPSVQHSGTDELVLDMNRGSRLTFVKIDEDTVAIVELTESSQPSVLDGFETDMTPLEVFFHFGGTADAAPDFLWAQHERGVEFSLKSSSSGQLMSLSNDLPGGSLDGTEEHAGSEITAPSDTSAAPTVKGLFAANCSFESDGGRFDDMWQDLGWSWHWYYSGQTNYKSTPPVYTNRFRTHLCNYSNGPRNPRHSAVVYSPFAYISQEVPQGYRSYISINQTTKRNWRARRTSDYYSESGYYRLGAMAPP